MSKSKGFDPPPAKDRRDDDDGEEPGPIFGTAERSHRMDERAEGGMALGLVALTMAMLPGVTLVNRAGVAPMWIGLVVAVVATSEAHRR